MSQLSLGEELRDAALVRVAHNADADWKDIALDLVEVACRERSLFTTDHVWWQLERLGHDISTHEPRAMGAIMRKAASAGWCVATDQTRKSVRPQCHARPVRVWRSLL